MDKKVHKKESIKC